MTSKAANTVALVGPLPPPIGGQSTLVKDIFSALSDTGYPVEIYNISHQIHGVFLRSLYSLKLIVGFIGFCMRVRPVVVHIHSSAGLPLLEKFFFAAVAKLFGAAVLMHIHGGKMRALWSQYSGKKRNIICFLLRNLTDGLIVLSEDWRRFYKRELHYRRKIFVLPNAVSAPSVVNQNKHPFQGVTGLFIGKICVGKGLSDLASALNSVQLPLQLNLAGPFEPSEERALREEFAAIESNIKVNYLGIVMDDDKWDTIASSDFLILPSHSEDLPISIIESLSLAKPVIASDVGSVSQLVQDGRNGLLFQAKDVSALNSAICKIVENKELRLKMAECAKEHARNFLFDTYQENLIKIYTILGSRKV